MKGTRSAGVMTSNTTHIASDTDSFKVTTSAGSSDVQVKSGRSASGIASPNQEPAQCS
jgi:hypothetical protein